MHLSGFIRVKSDEFDYEKLLQNLTQFNVIEFQLFHYSYSTIKLESSIDVSGLMCSKGSMLKFVLRGVFIIAKVSFVK